MSENWVNLENMHQLSWDKCQGLIPAIVQEAESKKVLMLAYMNRESLEKTLAQGLACFYSRSRASLWLKGETSGNTLEVINISTDCDLDTLLLTVKANGPSCHRDTTSCFDHVFSEWDLLWQTIDSRADTSSKIEESYTQKLLSQGVHRIAQKVGEEAVETALAAKDDDLGAFLDEASDLVYHLLVLLKAKGARPQDIGRVLHSRKKAAKK